MTKKIKKSHNVRLHPYTWKLILKIQDYYRREHNLTASKTDIIDTAMRKHYATLDIKPEES